MPIFQIETRTPGLDEAIDDLLSELKPLTGDDPVYAKTVEQLVKLHELKLNEKPEFVKPDTLALIAANVIVTLLVLNYEQKNVITSKFQNFISKTK